MAILLAACNPPPPAAEGIDNTVNGPSVDSVWPSKPVKAAQTLILDSSNRARPGQLAIADVVSYSNAKPAISVPAGWALIRDDSGPPVRQSLYWHMAGANEPRKYVWTFGEPADAQGAIVLLNRAAPASPVGASSGVVGVGERIVAKSVTTGSGGNLILAFYANNFGGAGYHAPGYMGEIADVETRLGGLWILGTYQRQAGATGDAVCFGGQTFSWIAAQVAIRRAAVER